MLDWTINFRGTSQDYAPHEKLLDVTKKYMQTLAELGYDVKQASLGHSGGTDLMKDDEK